MAITEVDLKRVIWDDISVQQTATGAKILILICKTKKQAATLLKMLHENAFDLQVSINEKTKRYHLALSFSDSEYGIGCDTGKTEKQYPPLGWLKNNSVKFVTTGIWSGTTPDGFRISWYDLNFKELKGISLN